MKTLYLDCGMGAAGDMLTAALLELIDNKNEFIEELNALGIPKVKYESESSVKCGITGTHMKVTVGGIEEGEHDHHHHHDGEHDHHHHHDGEHDHHHHHEGEHDHHHHHDGEHDHHHHHDGECDHHHHDVGHEHHHHSGLHEIEHIVYDLKNLSAKVKKDVMAVYSLIAEAESKAHGVEVSEIHFHEVGTMDAVADVVAVCLLIEKLNPDKIIASPVHVGSGSVRCAHGILPVPAPATAYILRDVPIYGGEIKGELCTPTGAALLKHFASQFGKMPIMTVEKIGYGMGKKDFDKANCVRAMLGSQTGEMSEIIEFTFNVDDMTPERIGFAMECLFNAGAIEVYTVPIGMKKSRPGTMVCVMCRENKKDEVIKTIFKHTTTLGVRENTSHRHTLERSIITEKTSFGDVRVKCSSGYGVERKKYEYDDLAKIAKEKGLSLDEIVKIIEKESLK